MQQEKKKLSVKRLCSEIQLFDLCELERCKFKENNFCTDPTLLEKFEAIADIDEDDKQQDGSRRTVTLTLDDLEEWDDDTDYGLDDETEEDDYSVFDYDDEADEL